MHIYYARVRSCALHAQLQQYIYLYYRCTRQPALQLRWSRGGVGGGAMVQLLVWMGAVGRTKRGYHLGLQAAVRLILNHDHHQSTCTAFPCPEIVQFEQL